MPALTVSQQARAETKIPAIRVAVHQIAFGAWPILTWEKQIWHIEFGACNKGGHFPPALRSFSKHTLHEHVTRSNHFCVGRLKRIGTGTHYDTGEVGHLVPERCFQPQTIAATCSLYDGQCKKFISADSMDSSLVLLQQPQLHE